MAHEVFLSYSSKDKHAACAACAVVERAGIRVWMAPRDIIPGMEWPESIISAINSARVILLVFSSNASESKHVRREIERAINKGLPVITFRIEDIAPQPSLELFLSSSQWLDAFTTPVEQHLAYLAESVQRILDKPVIELDLNSISFPIPDWSLKKEFEPYLSEKRQLFVGREQLFEEIRNWSKNNTSKERLALITGESGVGKSAFFAEFVLGRRCGQILAYHCFNRNEDKTCNLAGFVRNFSFMLYESLPGYKQQFSEKTSQTALKKLQGSDVNGPADFFINSIFEPLKALGDTFPGALEEAPVWIAIDALDEAIEPDYEANEIIDSVRKQEADIFKLIIAAVARLPPWVRILITCRQTDLADLLKHYANENGQLLVWHKSLDDVTSTEADIVFPEYINARLSKTTTLIPEEIKSRLLEVIGQNFLYARYAMNAFIDALNEGEAAPLALGKLASLPKGLDQIYHFGFSRLYPKNSEFKRLAMPFLETLAAARKPLPFDWLVDIRGLSNSDRELRCEIAHLRPYLRETDDSYERFHQSLFDWLLDAKDNIRFAIDRKMGHERLAAFCWETYLTRPSRMSHVAELESDGRWHYLIHYGIGHLIAAGRLGNAVELTEFIYSNWEEKDVVASESTAYKDVAPGAFLRIVLRACNKMVKQRSQISVEHLMPLLLKFYQFEPLEAPLGILFDNASAEALDTVQKSLLDADNYVLRFALAMEIANRCGKRGSNYTVATIESYFDSPDVNRREMAAYALCALYGGGKNVPIKNEFLERMGNSPTYPARSALGGLLVNFAMRHLNTGKESPLPTVVSKNFWEPIWEHNRHDIWVLKALAAISDKSGPPVDEGSRVEFYNIQASYDLQKNLLESGGLSPELRTLVIGFSSLGVDPERKFKPAEAALQNSAKLTELMRLFFSHPRWHVGETAASALANVIASDARKTGIVTDLLNNKENWRVRLGAVECSYIHANEDRSHLFHGAVNRFYEDPTNSRIRALCAENLIAQILELHDRLQEDRIDTFSTQIAAWVADPDCWVLEHVFRLFKWTAVDGNPCSERFLGKGRSNLLEGLPLSGWDKLPRETFLTHIEKARTMPITASPIVL